MSVTTEKGQFIVSDNMLYIFAWLMIAIMAISACTYFGYRSHQKWDLDRPNRFLAGT